MRKPSSRIIKNVVDIYKATLTPDTSGGPGYTYPSIPDTAQVRCSVQPDAFEIVDEQGRVTQESGYAVIFTFNPGVSPRDLLVWYDEGTKRDLFAQAVENQAGRNAPWLVRAVERL